MFRRLSKYNGRFGGGKLIFALVIALISVITYIASSEFNPITEETQQVALSVEEEVAIGLEAKPEMIRLHDGLHPDQNLQDHLDDVCSRLIRRSVAGDTDWPFECHLLADQDMINAFALPGGQMFITAALFNQLQTEGQLAGIMAHEMGHVLARHAAEQLAEQRLAEGLRGAAVIAAYDPEDPRGGLTTEQFTALIANMVNLNYSRGDELQSDRLGVRIMAEAGYDPRALIEVMQILAEAGEGPRAPEFFSTHPNPDNRIGRIQEMISEMYPEGVPDDLDA